ncbi:hypothetical protein EDC14_101831 [Hydrogenispora ethanolica]|uniref:Uncharacterized protein n=1 Tax=Hydrogenispora ethanolica TaxID=1082276 RepID=A0A4R1RFL1_HYDET|nr:hypothetical protein [Hydrogenispora ethanolica]TCL64733.1 hypothetical protein EDC14_101831 [Hydrogenispora ethanolica]
MLFAASVRVSLGKNLRRLDIVIEAEDLEAAKEKAIRQARKMYSPGKKAVYSILDIINEDDAYQTLAHPKPPAAEPADPPASNP